uniref:hypothetical protein n=1 Tax=Marinospirillum sp. TaxID=2183934 RepID=UPI003A849287
SLNPDDWEIITDPHDPVVSHLDVVGKRKIDPIGFYMNEAGGLSLFYNSGWADYTRFSEIHRERGYRPASNQTGSLLSFAPDWSFEDYPDNTVLDRPQLNWQGTNRVNPYALVWHPHHEVYYSFYGDFAPGGDCDKYPGRRALGLASSPDMINWTYLTVDAPLMHVESLHEIIPEAFPNTDFCRSGRLYAHGAFWHNDQIYLAVGGSINGVNYEAVIRSREPMEYWKPVSSSPGRPMSVHVEGKWYRVQNTRDPHDPNKRAIALAVSDNLQEPGENHYLFGTDHNASAGVSRQLFKWKGVWYIAYRQDDGEGFRDMYIARQVKKM